MLDNMLKLAICGTGRFVTRRILPALISNENIKLTAVIRRSGLFEEGIPEDVNKFTSLEDFLASNPSGAIYIATPNYLHGLQSLQCLKAGLHVLCEKPMATDIVDCDNMIRIARNLGLHLQIGHQLRYSLALIVARSWIQDNSIGKLETIKIKFSYELPVSARSWTYQSNISGGGCLMDAGIHGIDAIRFLTGGCNTEILGSKTDRNLHKDGLERVAVCCFLMGEANCSLEVNATHSYSTVLEISGADGDILINDFAASWGNVNLKMISKKNSLRIIEKTVDVSSIYANQMKDFAQKILNAKFDYSQSEEAAENVKLVKALYKFERKSSSGFE
jgi:predicted dehydrogenase